MLVLGDSYAARLNARPPIPSIAAAGVRGGCVDREEFRRWAIRVAAQLRPGAVVLVAGGNDLSRRSCRVREWIANLQELTLGMLAAGVSRVWVLPIPPRTSFREAGMQRLYRRRRWVANRLLQRLFRDDPVRTLKFTPPTNFLAADGVHPSAAGWCALESVLRTALAASPAE